MRFSILIPTIGRADLVRTAVRSVLRQTYAERVEIVVTDTSVSSTVSDMLQKEFPLASIVYAKVPHGDPSLGWDFAYQKSSGDYLLWLDDDNYLLPWTLGVVEKVIRTEQPDIITGQHVYYYDEKHPVVAFRNTVRIDHTALFDGKRHRLDSVKITQAIFHLGEGDGMYRRFSVHAATNFTARRLCEDIRRRTGGYIVLPHLRCNHSLNLMSFGTASSIIGVGIPFAFVGRLGASYTQTFHTKAHQAKRAPPQFTASPLSGDVFINNVMESFLLARKYLSPSFDYLQFPTRRFLLAYGRQLVMASYAVSMVWQWWEEVIQYAGAQIGDKHTVRIAKDLRAMRRMWLYMLPLRAIGVWRNILPFTAVKNTVRATLRASLKKYQEMKHPVPCCSDTSVARTRNITLTPLGFEGIETAGVHCARILSYAGIDMRALLDTILKY